MKIFLLLFLFWHQLALAFVNPLLDYPEEQNKSINIYKGKSKLELKKQDQLDLENLYDEHIAGSQTEFIGALGQVLANNFSMGTGRVDVTYQVKRGTELALKQIFAGYPEYQRRKLTEEVLNANYQSHKITDEFLLSATGQKGFNPTILGAIKNINENLAFRKIHELLKLLSYALLVLITCLIIFRRMGSDWDHAISAPLFNAVFASLIISFIGPGLNIIISLMMALNDKLIQLLSLNLEITSLKYFALALNWQKLIDQTGYLPGLILSSIDILAQFFLYFFVTGLILSVIIGKILSPLWGLALITDSLKSNAINSFVQWLKSLISMVLISLIYLIIKYISNEFNDMGFYFMEISLSIASFIYLPALASVILSRGHGIFEPALGGYRNIVDSINNSYEGIRAAIEFNSRDQLVENQLRLHEDLLYDKIRHEDDRINR